MNLGASIRVNKFGLILILFGCVLLFFYLNGRTALLVVPSDGENTPVNLKLLLFASIDAAIKGGEQVYNVISENKELKEKSKGKTLEGVNVPVTDADMKSHCVMFYSLTQLFPQVKVISEEHEDKKCNPVEAKFSHSPGEMTLFPDEFVDPTKVTVWIDPLDATKEYTEGLHNYVTTMVCVAYEGRPIIGVIHKPFHEDTSQRTYWTWIGKGKSKQFENPIKEIPEIVLVSRSHAGAVKEMVQEKFGSIKIEPAGGSGYKSIEVALGRAKAYVHKTQISKWDVCAGDAIIKGNNGIMKTLKDFEIDYSSTSDHVNSDGLIAFLKPKSIKA